MKLYIKIRNIFFAISIIVLLMAFVFMLKFNNAAFGYFLLGIFASTLIITIQSHVSSQIEESKLLVNRLKKMMDLCIGISFINEFSLEHQALDFENNFFEYKEKLEKLFTVNFEIGNMSYLNSKTLKKINNITHKIADLQIELHFIFSNFQSASNNMKILYFIEFYKIIKKHDVGKIGNLIADLGWELDSKEFYNNDFSEKISEKIQNLEYEESIEVYNEKIRQNNDIEYRALKDKFKKFMKK